MMNKRLKKKVEKNRRDKFVELFDLALQANGLEERLKDETGNLPTVFLDFSGHVSKISVSMHPNGWERNEWRHNVACKEVDLYTNRRYRESDYQEVKGMLLWAIEKARKTKPQQ